MENIMILKNGSTAKYIDFGLSKVLVPGEISHDRYGTMAFCAPEILMGRPHTVVADVWSIGVIFHILLSGLIPFLCNDKN